MVPFTHIMICMVAWTGAIAGTHSHIWAITTCLLWGSAASFHTAWLCDPFIFQRMAQKNNWSMLEFHLGNFVLHILPLYFTIIYPPLMIQRYHGFIAAFVHLAWTIPNGSIYLNELYVHMIEYHWHILWFITVSTECTCPLFF